MRSGYGVAPATSRPARQPGAVCDPDTELAALLARDLPAGFERLVCVWQDRLYAFALRMTGSPSDAEDIAQETLVRAWRALGDYRPERRRALQVRPWLFQIAVNLARNAARDASHLRLVSLDAETAAGQAPTHEPVAARLPDDNPESAPEESFERRQRLEALAAHLLRLTPAQRLAVTLRHVEGMSYGEIALVTGLPAGTIKSHVSRGAAELRRAIEHERAREAHRERMELLP